MADAFASLGTKVTVISTHDHILSKSEPELADMLKSILEKKGVEFKQGLKSVNSSSNKIELKFANDTIKVDKLLVATGREPNINLDLDAALVKYNNNGIEVKRNCVTSNNSIFAIGDCCNVPRFTHMAGHMGRGLVTNLTVQKYLKLPISIMGYCKSNIPAVTFTSPELAQSGLTTGEAKSKYGKDRVKAYTLDLSGEDRLMTQNHEQGKVILVTVGPLAKIVGVHILSKRAGEILPEFQLMIQKGMRIKDLGQFIRAYPTYITKVDHLKLEWLTSIFKK